MIPIDERQAEVVHDGLVRLLNLDPSQVRAGAFSVVCGPEGGFLVTWDGGALITGPEWAAIADEAGIPSA